MQLTGMVQTEKQITIYFKIYSKLVAMNPTRWLPPIRPSKTLNMIQLIEVCTFACVDVCFGFAKSMNGARG